MEIALQADLASQLSGEYEYYWRRELASLSEQWVPALLDFWADLDNINTAVTMTSERRIIWVALRYELYPCGITVYTSPIAHIERWTQDHAMALISALDVFHRRISETCEQCGSRKGYRHKTQFRLGGDDRILCEECGQIWREQIDGC